VRGEGGIVSVRSVWVDYAKGIGIVLVVYGHIARGVFNAGINYDHKIYLITDHIIYSFHMPLFFFLSGLFFVASLEKYGAGKLFYNKLDTLIYPYVIWSLLQGGVEFLLSKYTNNHVTFLEVISLFWAPRAQFWYLYSLFFVFIVAILAYSKLSARYLPAILLIAALINIFSNNLPDIAPVIFTARYFVFFALGIYFNQIKEYFFRNVYVVFPLFLLAFILFQWVFPYELELFNPSDGGWSLLLLGIVSIIFVVLMCMFLSRFNIRFLAYLGTSSLGIYLMHTLFGSGTRIILQKIAGVDSAFVHLTLGTVTGIFFSLVTLFFLEKFNIRFLFHPEPNSKFKPSAIVAHVYNWVTGGR
jgi:fucose 4-O-acetylase-like acetyltransferase